MGKRSGEEVGPGGGAAIRSGYDAVPTDLSHTAGGSTRTSATPGAEEETRRMSNLTAFPNLEE